MPRKTAHVWPRDQAANARSLATALAVQTSRLEAANARYEEWSARTASTWEMAGKAKAELQRRGQEPAAGGAPGLQSMATWWREFQADADAMDRAIEREHQAAVNDAQPWPPDRKPEAWHEEPDAAAPGCETQLAYVLPGILQAQTDPEPEASKLETSGPDAADPGPADDGRAARLDELQARADEAARRFDAQRPSLTSTSTPMSSLASPAQQSVTTCVTTSRTRPISASRRPGTPLSARSPSSRARPGSRGLPSSNEQS